MEVNIGKCGVIGSPDGAELVLSGQIIPRTTVYRYLGFPHKINGIDFQEHVTNMADKTEKMVGYVMRQGKSWPEGVKLAIYKSFIRPMLDWGSQLWFHVGTEIDRLEEIQKTCLKWIIPYSPHTSSTASVLALATLKDRMEALAASFVEHWQNRRDDHPINDVLQLLGRGPWSKGLLLPRLGHSILRQRLMVGFDEDVTMKERLRFWTWQQCLTYAVAGRYITVRSRARKYGTDKTIYWKHKESRQMALSWRVGSFGVYRRCPTLMHRFNRGCLVRGHCDLGLIRGYPSTVPEHNEPLYNGIDFTINEQCPDTAKTLLKNMDDYLKEIRY